MPRILRLKFHLEMVMLKKLELLKQKMAILFLVPRKKNMEFLYLILVVQIKEHIGLIQLLMQ